MSVRGGFGRAALAQALKPVLALAFPVRDFRVELVIFLSARPGPWRLGKANSSALV